MARKKKTEAIWQEDLIEPFIYEEAKVLILGTFPAPKARESGFYYAHPSNVFWKVLAEVFKEQEPNSNEEKKEFLKSHHIALWNMVHACYISGAKDQSIKEPVINDIAEGIKDTQIQAIFTSGKAAQKLYREHALEKTQIEDTYLPSTSAANRPNYSFDELVVRYSEIKEFL